jgi:hypothetical protein
VPGKIWLPVAGKAESISTSNEEVNQVLKFDGHAVDHEMCSMASRLTAPRHSSIRKLVLDSGATIIDVSTDDRAKTRKRSPASTSKGSPQICYPREQMVEVLRELNLIVVSLDRIGSASVVDGKGKARYVKGIRHLTGDPELAAKLTEEFFAEWQILKRLAWARYILDGGFSRDLGPDDMDELERELEGTIYWRSDQTKPPARWRPRRLRT